MMPRRVTVLEDNVKYRDGKKWKQRYCILDKPDLKTGPITMYIFKKFGNATVNQHFDEKSARAHFSDEITGFEYGRHVDKEGSVVALIGRTVVYCIAFSQNETMFRWAETLNKHFTSANFHATLKKISETSGLFNKINSGIQGNLHVQATRLCLIGEPADGNKFICEWPIESIVSVDIFNTDCDKVRELVIKSNGKFPKIKGNFEFEISVTHYKIFKDSFEMFIISCQNVNTEFKTNFKTKRDSLDTNQDTTSFSYSILCQDMNRSNSDNSSSLEKRSSEIPIPRSREHSGPDQRPIDNVQIKIRKSNKNFAKVINENKKHLSLVEANGLFDHDACLFDDDEDIVDQVDNKGRHFLYSGLSQESSGVYVNGASSSTRETNLSARMLIQDDSGCGNLSSTSSTHHDVIHLPNFLPPCHKRCIHKENVLYNFYRNVNRNPLNLANYQKYSKLLKAASDNHSHIIKRSSSFNCIQLPEKTQIGNIQKYSYSNLSSSLNFQISDQNFSTWKKKVITKIRDNSIFNQKETDIGYCKHFTSLSHPLVKRLPFRSTKEFHSSIVKSIQSGTECLTLFCYHHFLMILNDLKIVIRMLESQKSVEPIIDQYKYKIKNKQNIYNHWLENVYSEYNKSFDENSSKKPFILDINFIFLFEIANNIHFARRSHLFKNGSCDCIPRHQSDYMNNPTIELNSDKFNFKQSDRNNFKHSSVSGLIMNTSASTPDFRSYNHANLIPKQKKKINEAKYQNISPLDTFDTMNHTFPKQNMSINKSESSETKGGSFKKFRRKYSPSLLIPLLNFGSSRFSNHMFTRRKTPSTHSAFSEPISQFENKDHNNYYNINPPRQSSTKRSLSVVFDNSYPYEDPKECHNYINVQNAKGHAYKSDVDPSNYICSGPSSIFDDNLYPEEIIDPSINYGDLNLSKFNSAKFKSFRHDSENHNFRRSSISIISNKSFQNYGMSRPTSFKKHGYSNIHSDMTSHNTSGTANMYEYVNGGIINSSSPQSTQSCSPGIVIHSFQNPGNKSLNYVTVMENNYSHKFSRPLTIYPPNDFTSNSPLDSSVTDYPTNRRFHSFSQKRNTTPQSSPIVDYCEIDLHCTYALKAIDRMVYEKMKSRDKDNFSKNGSPEDVESCLSFDQTDNYSISSSGFKERKNKAPSNKKKIRRFFSRKTEIN